MTRKQSDICAKNNIIVVCIPTERIADGSMCVVYPDIKIKNQRKHCLVGYRSNIDSVADQVKDRCNGVYTQEKLSDLKPVALIATSKSTYVTLTNKAHFGGKLPVTKL